jgi:hypothetical protein
LFRIAVDAIVPNDDFAWSAFANEIALLNPDDLDSPTAVTRIVVVQYLSDVRHFNLLRAITALAWEVCPPRPSGVGLPRCHRYHEGSPLRVSAMQQQAGKVLGKGCVEAVSLASVRRQG